MGPQLLNCVLLCLLGAGPAEAEVTQTPRHLIAKTQKRLTINCSQNMNHEAMYWYRQDPGLGLRLIYFSRSVELFETGDVPDGYSVTRKEKGKFPLTLEWSSTNQTAVYLCASSLTTALHSQLLSAQKGQPESKQAPHSGGPPTGREKSRHHQRRCPGSEDSEQCSPSAVSPLLTCCTRELVKV